MYLGCPSVGDSDASPGKEHDGAGVDKLVASRLAQCVIGHTHLNGGILYHPSSLSCQRAVLYNANA